MTSNGTDSEYVVVFSGTVTSVAGQVGKGIVQFRAFDDLQGYLTRHDTSGTGIASTYRSPRDVITDLDTLFSWSFNGAAQFPEATTDTGFLRNVPSSTDKKSFGEIVDTALQGTGVNLTCDWNGPITAPVMRYRPDFFYVPDDTATISRARCREIAVYRPWLFAYLDYGLQFADFPSKVVLTGRNASSTDIFGWARLSSATKRNLLGNREQRFECWGQTQAELRDAADNLIGRIGDPEWVRQIQTRIPMDHVYRSHADLIAGEGTAPDYTESLFDLACVMLGDELTSFAPVESSWPALAQGDLYDEVTALWDVTIADSGDTAAATAHVVKQVTREWTPSGGWIIDVGLWPRPAYPIYSDAADKNMGAFP
jgi:hypothetical protein